MINHEKDQPGYVDDRAPMAKAMSQVSEIIAVCFMMVVPALIGIWLDRVCSTFVVFTIIGLLIGVTGAVMQIKRWINKQEKIKYDPSKIVKYEDDEEQEDDTDDGWD